MSNTILNFFDEEILINTPSSLSDLINQISLSFCLNLEDCKELLLSYTDINSQKISIKNENDFKKFLTKNIPKINIDINKSSKIFKNEILKQEEENYNFSCKSAISLLIFICLEFFSLTDL